MRTLLLLILSVLLAGLAGAQHRQYRTQRWTGKPATIDGILNEQGWDSAPWEGEFTQREPFDGESPSQQTAFKILYDDDHLYVGIRAFDSEPDKIERRLSRRDNTEGDLVAIEIDSYFDRLTAYVFVVNAAGVKGDRRITNDNENDPSWDPVWYVDVNHDSLGWTAEMKIPYSQLRFAAKDNYTWGLQAWRWIHRLEEFSAWEHVPQDESAWVSRFGDLEGIRDIRPRREVELIPYAMAKVDLHKKEEGNPFAPGRQFGWSAGLDGKVALTNDFTMNFTVNPDFGQVEADPSVVNLSAFETFFREQRPFFVEGSNIFDYSLTGGDGGMSMDNLFYSRRIGRAPHHYPDTEDGECVDWPENTRILGAFKLSGKTRNGLSIGITESVTNREVATIDSEGQQREEAVEPFTNYFNARVQQDFNKGTTILGGMFTATNRVLRDSTLHFLPASAYTGGVDFQHFWKDKTYRLGVRAVFSQISGSTASILELQEAPQRWYQRPDATHLGVDSTRTSLAGHGGTVEFAKIAKGNWRYAAWVTWRSPGLELNDMGFLMQSDIIQQILWAQYRELEPFSIFRRVIINVNQWSGWDFSGTRYYAGGNVNGNMQFKNYWSLGTGINRDLQGVSRSQLRGGPAIAYPGAWNNWLYLQTDERKKLTFALSGFNNWGDHAYRRNFDAGLDVTYRPHVSLSITLGPNYATGHNVVQYVSTIDVQDGKRYILGRIDMESLAANLRVNFSITPDLSIQYWGQPFVFAGQYSEFKRVDHPRADRFHDQFHAFTESEISLDEDNVYNVDENSDGVIDYSFDNPDFKVFDFRSNLVVRWEYIPGSAVYVVWSQGRSDCQEDGHFQWSNDMNDLFRVFPNNVFLVKLTYRISV